MSDEHRCRCRHAIVVPFFLFSIGMGCRLGTPPAAAFWETVGYICFWPFHIGWAVADWLIQR